MKVDKAAIVVTASALLTLSSISLLCCPTARAVSPAAAAPPHAALPPPASLGEEDSLDDDRAEHWAVPAIAREERTQSAALAAALLCAGAFSARRRHVLRGKRHD